MSNVYDDWLNTHAAAAYLNCSLSTLERYRAQGTGPAYCKRGPGKRAPVFYRRSALEAFLARHEYTCTSQYTKQGG